MHYRYLIVGGGMTAAAAIGGIREVDTEGSIGLFSMETEHPYNRPPLSKGLWKGETIDSIWIERASTEVDMHLGCRVAALDSQAKRIHDESGAMYSFDTLLLATGGAPRRLPFGDDKIIYFRTLDDYRLLRAQAEPGRRFAVVGGGFIASEIAAALQMNGADVTMIMPGGGIGEHLYPPELVHYLTQMYRQRGITVRIKESIMGFHQVGERIAVRTGSYEEIVDCVVAGIGLEPNVELAREAGLDVDNGIVVNEFLCTSQPAIYAAGDVAAYHDYTLGVRRRVEHEDNATTMGRFAGRAMAGKPEPYHHLPFFYSDLFDLGYEAVGEIDARMDIVADWKDPYREGVIYYMRAGRVRGVLLWNVWDQVDAARRLIAEQGPLQPADLIGRLSDAT